MNDQLNEDKNIGATVEGLETGWPLNAQVAERVMGWVWMSRVRQGSAWLFPSDSKDVNTGEHGLFGEPIIVRSYWPHSNASIVGPFTKYDGHSRKNQSYVQRYSEDIAAAFGVVDKMGELGFAFSCKRHDPAARWMVSFSSLDAAAALKAGSTVDWIAPTLPEAICRAKGDQQPRN